MKNPAHREDVAVQPGLQGNHQSGKPPLKHAQVRIGLPNHFLMCRNSIQEPDLWRRVCQRAGAVLRWIWTNSHCGFHYLWHECHHDFREGSHLKMHIQNQNSSTGCVRIRVSRVCWGQVVHCREQHPRVQHQRGGGDQHGREQQGVLREHNLQGIVTCCWKVNNPISQMYGDFILESSPSTFNDSIRAYKVTSVLQHLPCKHIF